MYAFSILTARARCLFVWFVVVANVSSVFGSERESALSCGQTNESLYISGEIDFDSVTTATKGHRQFELVMDGLRWRARIRDPKQGTNSIFSHWEHGTDGESVYEVSVYNTNYYGKQLFRRSDGSTVTNVGRFNSSNPASATVNNGAIPDPSPSLIHIIWLAYLSGCELRKHETEEGLLPPLYFPDGQAAYEGHTTPATWHLSPQFPFAPQIILFNSRFYFATDAKGLLQKLEAKSAYTNLALRALGTTNIGGWTVPKRFSVVSFRPPIKVRPNDVNFTCEGILNRVNVGAVPEVFLPPLRAQTVAYDRRAAPSRRLVSYVVTDHWLTRQEVASMKRPVAGIVQERTFTRSRIIKGTVYFVAVSVLFTLVGAALLVKKQLKQK